MENKKKEKFCTNCGRPIQEEPYPEPTACFSEQPFIDMVGKW
jgi:hypothetical protein